MSRVFFIQASLNVKNRLGHRQLFMEKDAAGDALLKFAINTFRKVSLVDKVCVVTSDNPVDDCVADLVNALAKTQDASLKPLMLYRISADKAYAFSNSNIAADTLLNNIPLYGLYNANGIVEICEDISCEQGVFLPVETGMTLMADAVDKNIAKYGNDDCYVKPLYFFTVENVKKFLRQYLIKRDKESKIILAEIGAELEELRKLNLYSDEKLKDIVRFKKTKFAADFQNTAINLNILFGFMQDKQRKEDVSFADVQHITPLLNQVNLEDARKTISTLSDLSAKTFFDIIQSKESTSDTLVYPGYLEIEITSKCNKSCTTCPHTRLTRSKEDMSLDVFKDIIDETSAYVPFVSFSGYGEPTMHPNLLDMVKYAKEKQFFRVCLETNASMLSDEMLKGLADAGLDIIILNLNTIDEGIDFKQNDLPSSHIIERILEFNVNNVNSTISLVLQIVKTVNNNDMIEFYYQRWQHIVDKIVINPFNDFLGDFDSQRSVDFSPLARDRTFCFKTLHSLFVNASGQPHVCLQQYDTSIENSEKDKTLLDIWRANRVMGGKYDFCLHCRIWHMLDSYSQTISHGVDISLLEHRLYNEIVPSTFTEGEICYNNNEYEKALDLWEDILRVYPHHERIHAYLDAMLKK